MIMRLVPTLAVALVFTLAASTARAEAGQGGGKFGMGKAGGPFEFILEHSKDLNLTADQKKSIEDLKQKAMANIEKFRQDPELRKLMQEMKDARQSGDTEKMKSLREELRGKMGNGEGKDGPLEEIKKILNADQLAKVKELRAAEGGGKGEGKGMREKHAAGGGDEQARPDPAKGAPPVFDGDKKPTTSF